MRLLSHRHLSVFRVEINLLINTRSSCWEAGRFVGDVVDFGRAASKRRFVEDAAAGSGSDDEPDAKVKTSTISKMPLLTTQKM